MGDQDTMELYFQWWQENHFIRARSRLLLFWWFLILDNSLCKCWWTCGTGPVSSWLSWGRLPPAISRKKSFEAVAKTRIGKTHVWDTGTPPMICIRKSKYTWQNKFFLISLRTDICFIAWPLEAASTWVPRRCWGRITCAGGTGEVSEEWQSADVTFDWRYWLQSGSGGIRMTTSSAGLLFQGCSIGVARYTS